MLKFHTLTIRNIKRETPNSVSIVFDIPHDLTREFKFIPGQYMIIKSRISGKEIRRAYSICSSPDSGELRIAVKAVENGTFSVFATTILKKGDTLELSNPEGNFLLETSANNANNYIAIAAGSGITPIMAMVKATLAEEPKSTFTLIYGSKTRADTIFKAELDTLLKDHPNHFNLQYVYSKEQIDNAFFGRIDTEKINFFINDKYKHISFTNAFLCGPDTMINTAKETLIKNGISENDIYFELFTVPISSKNEIVSTFVGTSNVTVLLDEEETTFTMEATSTILAAALKEGVDAPHSCQGGICGSCLGKITDGNAIMDKNSILTDGEINEGFILTCQAHPTTQKISIDYDDV